MPEHPLVFVGVVALLACASALGVAAGAGGSASRQAHPFRQGLLTNLFNPKIAVFYSAFLPQLIGPGDPARSSSHA